MSFVNFFDKFNVQKKFLLDSGASSNFINKNTLKCFEHFMINNDPSRITLADGSVQECFGTAKVLMHLPSGDSIKILFKILPQTNADGYLGNSFLTSYDILNSEKRLRHIRTGSTIPFTIDCWNSEREHVDFALTLTDPFDKFMTPKQKSKDFAFCSVDEYRIKNENVSSKRIKPSQQSTKHFRDFVSEKQQYRLNDASPDPFRDKS